MLLAMTMLSKLPRNAVDTGNWGLVRSITSRVYWKNAGIVVATMATSARDVDAFGFCTSDYGLVVLKYGQEVEFAVDS